MSNIELKKVSMVLLDISGYTSFLKWHDMSLLHAEQIITELLESAIESLDGLLTLNKLEGDAAFLYTEIDEHDEVKQKKIIQQVNSSFERFNARQQKLIASGDGGCPCEACCKIDRLKLKAILHLGEVAVKRIRHFEELAGEDVIIIHRLLKNTIDKKEYLLITDKFYQISGNGIDGTPDVRTEHCEGIGNIKVMAYYPKTDDLIIPTSKRVRQYSGFVESMRLWRKTLWHRLSLQKRGFNNLPK
ncbi:MAG: DUF2652 domain-containing protein [Thermodesulfobacteriota bacterium]